MKIRIPEIVIDIDAQKIQNTAQKAAKKASKTIKTAAQTAKETAETVKTRAQKSAKEFKDTADEYTKKAQQTAENIKQEYMRIFNKPKLEQLSSEVTNLQFKVMQKDLQIKSLQNAEPFDYSALWNAKKESVLLQQQLAEKTREYNEFAAKQQACQQIMEEMNKKGV